MKEKFTKLLAQDRNLNPKKDFSSHLFPKMGSILSFWHHADASLEESEKSLEITPQSEKGRVLESFKEFTEREVVIKDNEKQISFAGGEIRVRPGGEVYQVPAISRDDFYKSLSTCTKCSPALIEDPKVTSGVLNKTDQNIRILFVGDSPKGDQEGTIFKADSLDLLHKMAKAMNLAPNEYALTLAIKCPLNTSNENKSEMIALECRSHLLYEILFYKPLFVITLGAKAAASLLKTNDRLTQIHGNYFEKSVDDGVAKHNFTVVPLFHPEYLLINPAMKKTAWADMQKVMKTLGESQA